VHLNFRCSRNIVNVANLFVGMVKVVSLFGYVVGVARLEIMLLSTLNIMYIGFGSKSTSHIGVPSPLAIIYFIS